MKTTTKQSKLIVLLLLFVFSTFAVNAQVAINAGGAPPTAGAMLDVSSSNQGMLVPRVSYGSISALTVQGLLVYVTAGGPGGNGFYYYDSGWKKLVDGAGTGILPVASGGTGTGTQFSQGSVVFAGSSGIYSEDNTNFVWDNTNKRLGLGASSPVTNLNITENNTDLVPAILVAQGGTGDAAIEYYLSGTLNSVVVGLDNSDNDNYKISNTFTLTGTSYTDPNTLMRIHTEAGSVGIIDVNHQSRARAWLSAPQIIPAGLWTGIEYDAIDFDEHGEFIPSLPGSGIPGQFIALEDGYYQVNARTEFATEEVEEAMLYGYVSIAIAKNQLLHSIGNNLQVVYNTANGPDFLYKNNAPNVSDVVYLKAGETIEIWVWQNFAPAPIFTYILPSTEVTYVSIHKIS